MVRPEREPDPRVRGPGEGGDVADQQGAPPADADLGDAEDEQDLRQRPPHRQVQGGDEQGQRGAHEGQPERVGGFDRSEVLDRLEPPGGVLHDLEDRGQTDRAEGHRDRPPRVADEGVPDGPEHGSPLTAGEPPEWGGVPRCQRRVSRCLRCSHFGRPGASRKPSARPAATPIRSRSELFSKSMNRGSQIGRYLALAR